MTLPAQDSYDILGGELIDYSVVEDPQTDLSAEASNSLRADIAGVNNTCYRAILSISVDNTFTVSLISGKYVWNDAASTAVAFSYQGVGIYRITFPQTVTDLRGNIQYLNLLGGQANFAGVNTQGYQPSVNRQSEYVFDVYLYNARTQSLDDSIDNTIDVYLR